MEAKIIGGKIAQARKQVNISQADLAKQLFISPQAVGKWERGESVPDIITMNRLAEILGVDLNYFSQNFPATVVEKPAATTAVLSPEKQEDKLSWDMSLGSWVDADFSGLKNLHEKISTANMQRCKFIGSDMAGLQLKGNNIEHCDFSGSDMSRSRFEGCHMVGDIFKDCDLKEAQLSSYLNDCDFTGADFTGAKFKSASCHKTTLARAVLSHTAFIGTDLMEVTFEGTVEDCYFENCTFSKTIFRSSTLTNTFFKGRSLKRIQFIDCQADRMTYEFLKNGKADLTAITLITL
ncbi:pentapeptide repeat-containing protein [Chitinophaga qingshengii]|uniref:Pentapeptide repeat-containing protein n=1 Tax=Chitinophaga qingshengii TaxID=1569794 RepID=A0ABR7TT15_9BACT|nr:pentapeptide repeat-containing protein [Chitinophaga qingshengii]MBC9932757.1 pentapeptide repeat-containing protein [Chitinophaga qingshengii]